MKARDFDQKFDAGADISGDVDWGKARRPNLKLKRVNVDFPGLGRRSARPGSSAPRRDAASAGQAVDRRAAGEGGGRQPSFVPLGLSEAPPRPQPSLREEMQAL
jgi:hypothetical protein